MKFLIALCVAALVLAFCMPAFAETQNVKVSGDIKIDALERRIFNLDKDANTANTGDTTSVFMQHVGLNVAADLTDNVSTYVRLLNERDWNATAGLTVYLDQAYLTLKEFLYAPLTVKIGRQDMWFGRGFIVGANTSAWDIGAHMEANEFSESAAFDAIRGTLDYDPWTIDLVMAKIDENTTAVTDDVDLYGANVGYKFDKYNAEAEAYYWLKYDMGTRGGSGRGTNTIDCVGIRGSFVPYEAMNIWGEIAGQYGRYKSDEIGKNLNRKAWAGDIGGDYTFAQTKWTPVLGAEYVYYSGQQAENTGEDWEGWDLMYRGSFYSQIREFQNILYATAFDNNVSTRRNNGGTNQHQVVIRGSLSPMEDVKLESNVNMFWLAEKLDYTKNNLLPTDTKDAEQYIGTEWDAALTYDYTEDVKFVVAGGVFWPGQIYPSSKDDVASQAVATCSVDF